MLKGRAKWLQPNGSLTGFHEGLGCLPKSMNAANQQEMPGIIAALKIAGKCTSQSPKRMSDVLHS
jgi:hypothetical protein